MANASDTGPQNPVRARVDFFIVNLPTFDVNAGGTAKPVPELDTRLAELTTFFTIFTFNLAMADISFAPSWDAALERSTKDFVLIQNVGQIFYGQDNAIRALNEVLDQCTYMMGHIMDVGGYFFMHDQSLLVNRRAWERLGRSKFGNPAVGKKKLAIPHRSTETVHDNYTPLYLEPTGRELELEGMYGYGWEAISSGLAQGARIVNWPDSIRKLKRHCYAYFAPAAEWIAALRNVVVAESEDPQLSPIITFLRNTPDRVGAPRKVFVFNGETDLDVPLLRFNRGIDTAFMLAAGFKTNRVLHSLGFHDNTHVVVYDYSQPSLALRRLMVEAWDGRDFGAFLTDARPRVQAQFEKGVAFLPVEITADPVAAQQQFFKELSLAFSSMDEWLAHWQRYRALKHTFVEVDMMGDLAAVRGMFQTHAKGHAAIWVSDMFNSPYAVGKYDWSYRKACFANITDTLAKTAESYLVVGGEPRLWLK